MVSSRPGTNFSIRSSRSYLRRVRHRRVNFPFVLNDMHADGRTLARRFDDERNGNGRALANGHDLPVRRRDTVLTKRLLRANLVESQLAFGDPVAGIGDPALFQNPLHLAVFTKGSVERDEGEIDAGTAIRSPDLLHRLP